MKSHVIQISMILLLAGAACQEAQSQSVLKKLREKAQNEMINKVLGEEETSQTPPAQDPSRPGMSNTQGGGLENVAPDVNEQIKLAENAYQSKNYKDARFSARQALLGVELEMGKNVLKDLPETVGGLSAVREEDRVTSSGIGFVGLAIERVYRNDEQELRVTIGNNTALLSAASMYLSSGYASSDPDHKVITFQGQNGVIEYNESSGYTLSVPFGQSSILVVNGVNFPGEQAMMNAAEKFDISRIKKELGEQ